MIVFNLACEHEHPFEGWFGSADDFDAQLARGLVECPICNSRSVRKLLSAPRLNLSGAGQPAGGEPVAPPEAPASTAPVDPRVLQAMVLRMARHLVRNTEDVGDRFADEARRIHYREAPERAIRGQASAEDARALSDEGIEFFSFPLPAAAKEPLQ
jgi:hypothetical protein